VSPSGAGVHLILRGRLPEETWHTVTLGDDRRIEVYDHDRFFTMTGMRIGDVTEIRDRQAQLDALVARHRKVKAAPRSVATPVVVLEDEPLIAKALAARNGDGFAALWRGDTSAYDGDHSRADLALCSHLSFWTGGNEVRMDALFRQSGLYREKWERTDYRERTIAAAIEASGGAYYTDAETHGGSNGDRADDERDDDREAACPASYYCNDDGNALRFADQFGDRVRYLPGEEVWLVWDGRRWQRDDAHMTEDLMTQTTRSVWREASECADDARRKELGKWAIASGAASRCAGGLFKARSNPALVIRAAELDRELFDLNLLNGTLDLHEGALRPHRQADHISRLAPVEWKGLDIRCEVLEKFLTDTTGGDHELRRWIQRAFGMSLTGLSPDVLLFLLGGTQTGKSTLAGAMESTLGPDYAMSANQEALLRRDRVGGPRESIADMEGRRLIALPEFDRRQPLDEPLLKRLTGGDTIRVRGMYAREKSFRFDGHIWIHTNVVPRLTLDDEALWRRIRVVPLDHRVKRADPAVKAALCDPERSGAAILAWGVQGCLDWQREGLGTCAAVDEATAQLRRKMDPLIDFFDDCCVFEPGVWASSGDLQAAFAEWASKNGVDESKVNPRDRAAGLRMRGAEEGSRREGGGKKRRGWSGVALCSDPQGRLE
ncbi:MAG: hypothetical protein FJ000_05025, partial [Actinobacteria bacterium]|nr:hypothetical protein [Actinomycetota bacterium]